MFKTKSILLVDDDVGSLDVLTIILQHKHYQVVGVADANTALELLLTQPFDVAIIDLRLPETDGWQLLDKIRSHHPLSTIRTIALTAYYTPTVALRAREAGFDACLSKPVTKQTVKHILNQLRD
jgi:CheY-like chemotaxis protein